MNHQKKCPNCGAWNEGELKNCMHCGELLDKNEVIKEKRKKLGLYKEMKKQEKLFQVFPNDPVWMKVLKYVGAPLYWVFMAILGFILWFIAFFAG